MINWLKNGIYWQPLIFFLILVIMVVGVGFLSCDNRPVDLTNIDNIEYKSIETSGTPIRYFAIDSDGNVYRITQEDWAELEVPVLSK